MKTRLIFSTIALAIAGWCHATGYTLTLYADGCESANVIKCDVNQQVSITAVPKNARRHFVRWTDGNTDNPRTVIVTQDTTFTAEFAIDQYTITASGEHGTIEGTGTYDYNTKVYLTAVPDKGYHFAQWSNRSKRGWSSTDNPLAVRVYQDTTFTAEFRKDYTITSSGEHGTVEGTGTYDYNSLVYLTAVPDKGYHFTQWSDGNTDNPRAVIVTQDTTFTAEFAISQYTITASSKHGTVKGTGTYDYNTKVYLTAVPDKGYHFVKWDDGTTYNPYYVYVRSDAHYTAEFAPNQYTITASGEHGTVEGTGTYDYNTKVYLTAVPDKGYHFVKWSNGKTYNPYYVYVRSDTTLTAEFAPNQYTITTYAQNGSVSGGGMYDYGTTATLTAIADEHYHFTQWSDGNTDNPRTVAVEDNATYTADFKPNSYTITVSAGEHGSANSSGTYDYGTTATLTATADAHYHFTRWNDGNTDNPRTVSVEGDATYTAEFAIDQHTITTNAQNGTITGSGTYDYGTTTTLTATADAHYHFTQWNDGNTDNPRTISVEGDATYTAEFLLNEYTITVLYDNIKGYVSGGGTYVYGTQVRLEVSANSGYEFAQWSNGATYNPYLLTATEDLTLEAQFVPTTAVENVSADDDTAARKLFRDGQVFILRGSKTYTLTGEEVK